MSTESELSRNIIVLEVGPPGDTWRYCIERRKLAKRSECFRAMLLGPLAPAFNNPPPVLKLQNLDKRAFDNFLRYLLDEPIYFNSVSTARASLDVAHQYLCTELAHLAVNYIQENLNPSNVLEVYHGLIFYVADPTSTLESKIPSPLIPSAPPEPGDEPGEIAAACSRLFHYCLLVIDSEPETIFSNEGFEELLPQEVEAITSRDSLCLRKEITIFSALDRWAASACRRKGQEPTPFNKRSVLSDQVWFTCRYLLMTDKEFIQGPMASGILTNEESAYIVSRILGHIKRKGSSSKSVGIPNLTDKLTEVSRVGSGSNPKRKLDFSTVKMGKEQDDNRKNRRKECAKQARRACASIGYCLTRVVVCLFG